MRYLAGLLIAGLLTLALLTAFGACGPMPNPVPPTPVPAPDAAAASCATACAQGTALGCPWSKPTLLKATCEEVCANAAAVVPWPVGCISTAATCQAADSCP